jgi:hypothetical protein
MSIQINGSKISAVYYGSSAIGEIYYGSTLVWSAGVTLMIAPTPSNATVSFSTTGTVNGNSIKVKKGTTVSYTVSCSGYDSKTGTLTVSQNQTLAVALEKQIYTDNQVVFEQSVAGSYTANLEADGQYEVIAVGGGGGAGLMALGNLQYTIAVAASGGSGAVVDAVFRLSAGSTSITVGALGASATIATSGTAASQAGGTTTVGAICSVGGGGAGKAGFSNPVVQEGGSAGTVLSYDTDKLVSSTLISDGNAGTYNRWYTGYTNGTVSTPSVQSPYPPYGSGSGGSATTYMKSAAVFSDSLGSAGYVKIIYKGK